MAADGMFERRFAGRLAGWTISDKLRVGTHGLTQLVFRPDDAGRATPFVVKRYNRKGSDEGTAWHAAEVEARALRQLSHRGIISLVEAGRDSEGVPYIVLPFFASGQISARVLLDFTLPNLLRTIQSLVITLGYVHGRGFVHGDIAVCNTLIEVGRGPVLIDFAQSKQRTPTRDDGSPRALDRTTAGGGPDRDWDRLLRSDHVRAVALYNWILSQGSSSCCRTPYEEDVRRATAERFHGLLRARNSAERDRSMIGADELDGLIGRCERDGAAGPKVAAA